MKRITILLAEDHTLVREGIRMMLKLETDFDVVGEAQNGRQAIELAIELNPNVVLIDIAMPGLNGLEATRQLLKARHGSKIVILTAHCDDAYVRHAAESGAMGFLLKQDSTNDVCRAIREVHQGHFFVYLRSSRQSPVLRAKAYFRSLDQIFPSSSRMIRTSRIKPSAPLGKYPQLRLCGHVGIAPSKSRIITIKRMVPIDMALFGYPHRIHQPCFGRACVPIWMDPMHYYRDV